ncbi:protein FMC1 homolog isoform X2 [Folsomia candida]|nr:protein FMC1 homolog isoform X2 [Folsomia candida]
MSLGQERGLHLLRALYRELRPSVLEPNKHVYQTPAWKYIVKTCRECPPSEPSPETISPALRVGEYYVSALRGTREYLRIHTVYKGKGERSPKDLAEILGFYMPDDPTPDPRKKNHKTNRDDSITNTPNS